MVNLRSSGNSIYPGRPEFIAKLLFLALAYFASGRLSLLIPYLDAHITLIWLPAGIAVAALVRWGSRYWPGIFIGALVTNFSVDATPLLDCCIALGNTLGALFVAWMLRRMKFHLGLDRAYDIVLLVIAAILGMLLSASGGVISLLLFNRLPDQDAGLAWSSWWAGDFVGVLMAVPLLLNISHAELKKLWLQRVEMLAWLSIMLGVSWHVFLFINVAGSHSQQLVFLLLPVVIWSAMRFGVIGSSLGVIMPALIAAVATSFGLGPFYSADFQQGLLFLLLFFATLVLVDLMVAALQASRNRANEALRLDRDLNKEVVQSLPGIFYMLDTSGKFLMWNRQLETALGCSSEEIAQSQVLDFFAESERGSIEKNIRRVFTEGDTVFEAELAAKNGVKTAYHFTGRRIEHDGEPVLVGMGVDIAERKEAEQKSEVMLRRHQTLMKSALEGIHVMDIQGNIIEANETFCKMLGYSNVEMAGLNVADWDAQWSKEELMERFKKLIRVDGAMFETKHRRKDGSLLDVEVSTTGADIDGQLYLYAASRDITERKEAERTLKIMREREAEALQEFRVMLNTSGEGFWKVDTLGNIIEVNEAYSNIVGFAKDKIIGAHVSAFEALEPTPDMVVAHIRRIMELGTDRFVTKHRHRDGHLIDIEIVASYIEQTNCVIAFMHDVSERKKIEETLRIAAITFDTQEGIMITDADANILRVNQAFQDITGYGVDEVIGCNPRIFQSGRHDQAFFQAMWSDLLSTGKWAGEIWDKRKNGEIYPKLLTITAAYDDQHQVTHFVAVFRDISNRKKSEQEIHRLAFYDSLTMLPNRRLLLDRLQQALAVSARNSSHGALLFLDLDHFKTINDTRGHAMGDRLLIEVARRLQTCVRGGDSVARLGGDEFVVLLEDLSGAVDEAASQTESVAEKIRLELDRPYVLNDFECLSTVSIGISLFFENRESADDLLQHADVAMYQAKSAGRNAIRFFDPQMQAALEARAVLDADLRLALNKRQFRLYYQIQVDNLLLPLGAEVLLRWEHPELGLVYPQQFISLAEESGLIVPIGLWVLQSACDQLKEWQSHALTSELTLAVNVSAKQFRQSDFVAQVRRILQESGAKPSRLKLELTESTVLENVEDTISKMEELKLLGVSFSLDDFGTGYSSLQYLKRLPLDQIKIDQTFVHDIVSDSNDAAIVQTIIAMTEALGLQAIAEGVETDEQRAFLDDNGCHAFQGNLFSEPIPLGQLEAMLHLKQYSE
jgi:diguanylate cyclase (GGDEF)-like protein/PAS domain S-box-containing protein